ncbi:hypothetical protein NQ315_002947 [Exocentrus adspersus]|uniref:G-protein coupled receptors family 1 profile domain-containing protein n=1 Tax=Exocentrus adspersus TaxID=1586481 RepID=A0AAV8W4G9_9CUCU|nr:hypothetical protein NQ315_002947 [Exocentrus adspersus]
MRSLLHTEEVEETYKPPYHHLQFSSNLTFGGANASDINSTIVQLIAKYEWGPQRDPLYVVIPISVLYVIIFILGVLGNVSTCVVIARNKSMHTATNYYLFSLAISDLLLLISGLPPEMYSIWYKYSYIFGDLFCILQSFAAETSANATVLTITAFTIERYVAICHPFLSHTLSKLNRAIKFIVLIWLLAMCLAIPQAMAFGVICDNLANLLLVEDQCICTLKRTVIPHAFEISTFVFFVAPMTLITVLYVLIGVQLHRSTVGPSRGNSVKMKHRVYKPVSNCVNQSPQLGMSINGDRESIQRPMCDAEDGRKNYAKNAQATRHVVKMLGK